MNVTTDNKRIYIAGTMIDSRSFDDFASAEILLNGKGYEPVNPLSDGSYYRADKNGRILIGVEIMKECSGVFMLKGWRKSEESRILLDIAEELNKEIMFQSSDDSKTYVGKEKGKFIAMVKAAIREVMGTNFGQYDTEKKTRDVYFMRMIFTHHCRNMKMTLKQIKAYVHRDHSTMLHYLKNYKDEYKYNSEFREIADKVSDLLIKYKEHVEAI